ncbi:hypothetical protein ACE6H2_010392 [Prunus campanulata]
MEKAEDLAHKFDKAWPGMRSKLDGVRFGRMSFVGSLSAVTSSSSTNQLIVIQCMSAEVFEEGVTFIFILR